MELNEYQNKAMDTCMPSCENIAYMSYNLVAEVGELAGKIAKQIRKENVCIGIRGHINQMCYSPNLRESELQEFLTDIKHEAGDVLWQLSGLCKVMGWSLEEIAQMNLEKLASRKERGVIDGSGDNR